MPSAPSTRTEPSAAERLRGALGRALDRAPGPLRVRLSGRPPVVVDGQTLDPTVQLVLALRPSEDRARATREAPVRARARFRREVLAVRGPATAVGDVLDLPVDGAGGPLGARHYRPAGVHRPPLLVYFHGGGFTQGDLDTHDEPCRVLCRGAGHSVLSVAYRLAPEHPFPAAHDDALAAFRWAQAHAERLGDDSARVAVGGDSAGGNLAAATAQATRDDRPPAAQLLLYPPTDHGTDRPSRHLFDGALLDDAERRAFHHVYTRGTGAPDGDPRLSPLLGRLDGLAPALVVTAGFDVLRDEGEAFARALREAGTPVEAVREPALPHGFANLTGLSRAARAATAGLARRWGALVPARSGPPPR